MARGLGGDDGPSLFMVVAILAIWVMAKDWFGKAGSSLSGGVKSASEDNWANPIQSESNADISDMEKGVNAIKYNSSKLKHPLAFYQNIANEQYDEMNSNGNIDEDLLLRRLKGLTVDELKAVAKRFGVKDHTIMGVASFTGDIFRWYDKKLSDSWVGGNDLTAMKAIWKPTALW